MTSVCLSCCTLHQAVILNTIWNRSLHVDAIINSWPIKRPEENGNGNMIKSIRTHLSFDEVFGDVDYER